MQRLYEKRKRQVRDGYSKCIQWLYEKRIRDYGYIKNHERSKNIY